VPGGPAPRDLPPGGLAPRSLLPAGAALQSRVRVAGVFPIPSPGAEMLPNLVPGGRVFLILVPVLVVPVLDGGAFPILGPGGRVYLILVPGGAVFLILVPRRPVTRNPLRVGDVLPSLGRAPGRRLFLGLAPFPGRSPALGPARERRRSGGGCLSGPLGGGAPPSRGLRSARARG
jgi:hypothetical protein